MFFSHTHADIIIFCRISVVLFPTMMMLLVVDLCLLACMRARVRARVCVPAHVCAGSRRCIGVVVVVVVVVVVMTQGDGVWCVATHNGPPATCSRQRRPPRSLIVNHGWTSAMFDGMDRLLMVL